MTTYEEQRERRLKLYDESHETMPVSRERLLEVLTELRDVHPEDGHITADMFLLRYIDDEEIRTRFLALTRWYA